MKVLNANVQSHVNIITNTVAVDELSDDEVAETTFKKNVYIMK